MTPAERHILRSLAAGWTLKAHRTLDGEKNYRLHPLADAPPQPVEQETVESLRDRALLDSNKKFPAATYLLTDKGRQALVELGEDVENLPLTARGWQDSEA